MFSRFCFMEGYIAPGVILCIYAFPHTNDKTPHIGDISSHHAHVWTVSSFTSSLGAHLTLRIKSALGSGVVCRRMVSFSYELPPCLKFRHLRKPISPKPMPLCASISFARLLLSFILFLFPYRGIRYYKENSLSLKSKKKTTNTDFPSFYHKIGLFAIFAKDLFEIWRRDPA